MKLLNTLLCLIATAFILAITAAIYVGWWLINGYKVIRHGDLKEWNWEPPRGNS